MASTGSTGKDGSFTDRVDKVFGSLSFSKSSPATRSSADDEGARPTPPREIRLRSLLRLKVFRGIIWGRVSVTMTMSGKVSMIGRLGLRLASTLLSIARKRKMNMTAALGRENAGGRLYMSEVTDHGSYLNSHNVLPKTKDPRANHLAAKMRLEEDEDEAQESDPSEANARKPKKSLVKENAGERLYMSEVTDHGSYLNSHNVLPKTKDPRANHLAAKMRLEEDEDEAQESDPSKANARKPKKSLVKASENGCQPMSIVKRKDSATVFKSQKRVRFNHGCKDDSEVRDVETTSDLSIALQNESAGAQNHNTVPDYILNPSKYNHYTFDSSDVEESNSEAYMNLRRSKPTV